MAKYHFKVHTGDEIGAGTDSNIFVVLRGVRGRTGEYRLNGCIKGNAFERNRWDSFDLEVDENVGQVYEITLRSDNRYAGSDWLLDKIQINQVGSKNVSKFFVNEWIEDKKSRTYTDDTLIGGSSTKSICKTIYGGTYTVPAGAKSTKTDKFDSTIGIKLQEISIKENNVSIQTGVSKTALEADLKFALSEKTYNQIVKEIVVNKDTYSSSSQTVTFPKCKTEKVYRVKYTKKIEQLTIKIGGTTIVLQNVTSIQPAGYSTIKK